ncbi:MULTISPECIES: hypothetical protein [Bacillus]|jgi:hypothetical protein|uniref:Uncharacterized protein n=5 Tax=Bacillus cereus group TaxID=86661 RepID=A0A1C4C9Q7_BACMY|nr:MULTISPECIES: hypothetical protein [Bacillus cereus group]EJQ43235.1 hypothetical protein IEE_03413 [Bacillus cereus BAG5X1-1]EJR03752.1 hypothetical protein II3_00615 [Bacillus cereus MC67]EOP16322.1 hypothetical protein II1_02078 [Bacillus cereus MC118]EOP71392.1 hypothetical protein IIQ_00773 [Bacillus cereus VD118]MBJ7983712.1 hypothetical protein [Bacillus cereus]
MTIENLNDLVVAELGCKYVLEEKVFEAKNFTVYIATSIENKMTYNRFILIKHLSNEVPSVHVWDKKICVDDTKIDIATEVTEAIQSGFVNKE